MNRKPFPVQSAAYFSLNKAANLLLAACLLASAGAAQSPPQGTFNLSQTLSDQAQVTTLAFDGLAMMSGNLGAQSFFPPGKVADYTGFQHLRDNDPDNMGHNTSFLTRVANNMLYVLDDSQIARLTALAGTQLEQVSQYGYQRYPLMQAFRRLTDGTAPSGASLSLDAVKKASRELYLLDGQISFDRALLYANIYSSMTAAQKAYLAAMKGKGWSSWPDIKDEQIRAKLSSLPKGTMVLVMTYASDIFSWYAGSLEADVYFCPERHGTYYGGFYIKDAPAVGHEGYSISEQLTAEAGRALLEPSLGYVNSSQAAAISGLLEAQRNNLYAGGSNIVQLRTQIATLLRGLLSSTDSSEAVKAQVLELSGQYGELDGENNYNYATVFATVFASLTEAQKTKLATLRKSIMSGTYADGTSFDFSVSNTAFLYSDPITDPAELAPYIDDTDYLFSSGTPQISAFTASPASIAKGEASLLRWSVSGATRLTLDNGAGDVSGLASKSVTPTATTTYTLTATNDAGSTTAHVTVSVVETGCTLSASPASLSLAAGGSVTASLSCTAPLGGFSTPLALTVSGAPTGVSATVAPATLTPGTGKSTLTVSAAASVPAGSATLTLRATAGAVSRTLMIPLNITAAPGLNLTLAAASVSLQAGATAQTTLAVAHSGSFNSAVTLSAKGAPTGLGISFTPASISAPGDGTSTVKVTASASVAPGTYNIGLNATGGNLLKTQTLAVTVQAAPGFTLALSATRLSIAQGANGTLKLTVSGAAGGFASALALSATAGSGGALPTGLSAAFAPASLAAPGTGTSTLTLTVARTLAVGVYPLTVTATGGGVTRSTTASLTVTQAPGFTLTASPASLSVVAGAAVGVQVTSAATGGLAAPVTLSSGSLPTGVSASYLPASIASAGGRTVLKLQTSSAAAAGSYRITISGTATGVPTASTSVTLVVSKSTR